MSAEGLVKRIAKEHSVFQSDVSRFESAIREALLEMAGKIGWLPVVGDCGKDEDWIRGFKDGAQMSVKMIREETER